MTPRILSGGNTFSGPSYGPLVLASSVLLAISVTASLLFGYSHTERGASRIDLPKAMPELRFEAADGTILTLADFRGTVVLLNVWATWCVPCRKEMPAIDRLQARLGGSGFQVVALSIDRGGLGVIQPFFDEGGIQSLSIYLDQNSAPTGTLGITGVPTTLLIDREGREIQRWVGPAEWDSPEIQSLIRRQFELTTSRIETPSSNLKVR